MRETVDPLRRRASLRHSMHLSILLSAWTFSRDSVYQARFLLGLESRAIHGCAAIQLTELQRLRVRAALVTLRIRGRDWLWVAAPD